ncbi:MarR family transcriptional regulator [Nocardia suismassiliense]|uniref:MarR family transcriptional regulator n=1 Tax=Nocardia suismassiliense TaxID=2077092 RepID=UPI000D1DC437|nr:MarR family transcriptional regulator [Nocardia suismassiliense]
MSEDKLSRAEVAVLSFLLGSPAAQRQVGIAEATDVTQARVSQILAAADAFGWTERGPDGWQVRRPRELFERLVSARPPKVDVVESWYSLDTMQRQIELALEHAADQQVSLQVCGDWAADRVAPWRIPDIVYLHADGHLDLEAAGFVPVETSPADATIVVNVGKLAPGLRLDPAIATAMGGPPAQAWPLAPITEIARHLLTGDGPDTAEAVAELEQRFLAARSELERVA